MATCTLPGCLLGVALHRYGITPETRLFVSLAAGAYMAWVDRLLRRLRSRGADGRPPTVMTSGLPKLGLLLATCPLVMGTGLWAATRVLDDPARGWPWAVVQVAVTFGCALVWYRATYPVRALA